jgi:stage V sporulation protein S
MTIVQSSISETAASESFLGEVIKVSANSRSTAVAGAIAGVMRQHGNVDVQAIGAGAVYQAIKAIAIARKYLLHEMDITTIPVFTDVMIDEQERTAIRFIIEVKNSASVDPKDLNIKS